MARLNGGYLLIDLTPYGNFSDGDYLGENMGDTPEHTEILKVIESNLVIDENGSIINIKKPFVIKVKIEGLIIYLENNYILDDNTGVVVSLYSRDFYLETLIQHGTDVLFHYSAS